jgi:1,2-diacylglycerol 3-alpha-glucosyltransferase
MTGLRIAIASSGVSHVKRGIETWAVDLARALRARGTEAVLFQGSGEEGEHRITIPCLTRGSARNDALSRRAPGVFWRLGLKSSYEIEQTTFALNLLRSRKANRFDILHTQDPHLARILDRAHRAKLFSPRVLLAHGTEEPPEYLAGFSYLQHLAPQHAEEIRDYQKPGMRWFVGPNFVDTDRFRPGRNPALRSRLGIPEDAFVVVTTAAVKRHHKRIDYLIDEFATFANLASGDTHLIVAGASTDDTPQLQEQAHDKSGRKIHFLLDRPHEEMPDILRAGDLVRTLLTQGDDAHSPVGGHRVWPARTR